MSDTLPPGYDTFDAHGAGRPAPTLIHVPPSAQPLKRSQSDELLLTMAFALVLILDLPLVILAVAVPSVGLPLLAIMLAITALLAIHAWTTARPKPRDIARRETFVERHPDWNQDPLATALDEAWRVSPRLNAKDALAVIDAVRAPNPPHAQIICLGLLDVPDAGDYRFEPLIVTPTHYLWKRVWSIVILLAVAALLLVKNLHLVPIPLPIEPVWFGWALAIGLIATAQWLWRSAVRPTYLRLAPGIVQVLEYHFARKKPTLRSYPITPATVVILRAARQRHGPEHIGLARDPHTDDISLSQMKDPQAFANVLWRALLSTAPTPPLSDEDLLG